MPAVGGVASETNVLVIACAPERATVIRPVMVHMEVVIDDAINPPIMMVVVVVVAM